MTAPRKVTCPTCGCEVVWSTASRYRPFCSERCRQIDLGAWANEEYRVPAAEAQDDFDTVNGSPTPRE